MKSKVRKLRTRSSIQLKLTITLTSIIILIIFSLWFINRTFLEDYYLQSKIDSIGKTYDDINNIFLENKDSSINSSKISLKLERLADNRNVSVYIIATDQWFNEFEWTPTKDNKRYEQILRLAKNYLFDFNTNERLKHTDNYDIYESYDSRIESRYVDLIGKLDDGNIILMRTNLESIKESVKTANKLLANVGIVSVIIASVIMFFVSRKFSKPILQLADISKKMSDLDFEVKYPVTTNDEIGELGRSINTLSEKLEKTITELKNANNELLTDIQNKIQIDEMRKDFLSNVTHELKTPIALIQGYAEGLLDNINEDAESREFYCDVIIDEAKKMNQMVKKLLTLNQLEFGNNQVNIERFDIVALIRSILNSTDILFQQKEVMAVFDHKDPVYVWADEYLIEEVLTNYISNALNHVDGAKIIEIKLIRHDNLVRVAVFNTGPRIPEEDIDKIWDKFYKVDKARTREYGGSGIGLSIVKAIMTSLNQKCGVVNHESGVEFWFELDAKND
jgi:two-component system, OmpR family, sensor histidine kinase VanS